MRLLLVHPDGHGHGLGGRLVDTAVEFARDVGCERTEVWTNHPFAAAAKLYASRGFRLIKEQPHHSFGVDLVGQTYVHELAGWVAAAPSPVGAERWS
jgi:N-acetylglutamate synthase-like GNAT family acetyltransferase